MVSRNRMVATMAFGLIATVGGAATAHAITAHPAEGGVWNYGVWGTFANSNYLHGTKSHGSSVVVDGGLNSSTCIAAGYESKSAKWYWPISSKNYYYRLC